MLRLNCPYTFSQVPYIVNEGLDEYAEAVLNEAMPDVFCFPQPIDAERFLEFYLGLQVEYKKLSYNSKVLGLTAFNDGFIQVFNEQSGRPEPLYVKSGTVVVDTSLLHKRNEARLRFTLMHEGSHWLLHQRAFSKHNSFFSNEKYDNQYLAAKEGRIDYSRSQNERNDIERIERQADFLASALLIPRPPLRSVYRDFFRYFNEKPMRIVRGKDLCHDSYGKRGFTKQEALDHEAEMRIKLSRPGYQPIIGAESKQTVREYLEQWVENHGKANLRPSTFASYKGHIKNHILPYIGSVQLKQLRPAMLDDMFQKLSQKGLSQSSVRYTQRIMSVSLEAARKYRYIETNPARDILTKFGKQGKTPDPYTVEQMRHLMGSVMGTEWEMIIVLAGMYGLRLSEIIGLRTPNIDLEKMQFKVVEQLPFNVPGKTKIITEMAPTKSSDRVLPITEITLTYFVRHFELLDRQKYLIESSGAKYYENHLFIPGPDGGPFRRDKISTGFGQLLRRLEMPHMRFHDLRHTAATNMHQLTGDFYTVGEILGHTLKGIGITLGISGNLDAVTKQYVEVRVDRKRAVLDAYHNALHPQQSKENEPKSKGRPKKKSEPER